MRLNKKQVRLIMARLCITQKEPAERSGCSAQTISYLLNGKSCRPDLLGKIAKALEVEPEIIIE